MSRKLITAAAQMAPIANSETRADTVNRLLEMVREAKARGSELVVFTELTLTALFPRWRMKPSPINITKPRYRRYNLEKTNA